MLLVFYGLTLDVGHRTRTYFQSQGFKIIQKRVYEDKGTPVKSYFTTRGLVEKEEIDDCEFQYNTNYGVVGFNRADIFDAVYGKENAILAMTSDNVEFIHHIKAGYGDAVPVIAAYIDREAQLELFARRSEIGEEEAKARLATGEMAAKVILENRALFDDILIYGGENTPFNFEALERQLQSFLEQARERQRRFLDVNYVAAPYQGNENFVFLSYSHQDKVIAHELLAFLQFNGIRVWYDAGIPAGDNWMNMIADKVNRSAAVILLSSKTAVCSPHVQTEIRTAIHLGKKLIKINLDDSVFDSGIEMYLFALNQLQYSEISHEAKAAILKGLDGLNVQKPINDTI
jgi:hypothetical protein